MIPTETPTKQSTEEWNAPSPDRAEIELCETAGEFGDEEPAPGAVDGNLVGAVVDLQGRPVAARVRLRHETRAFGREYYSVGASPSGAPGRYLMREVPPGNYTIEIEAPGYQRELLTRIGIYPGCVTHLGLVRLRPGADDANSEALPPPRALLATVLQRLGVR